MKVEITISSYKPSGILMAVDLDVKIRSVPNHPRFVEMDIEGTKIILSGSDIVSAVSKCTNNE